jgi:hypothetical protein
MKTHIEARKKVTRKSRITKIIADSSWKYNRFKEKKNFENFEIICSAPKNLRILSHSNLRTEFPSSNENDFFASNFS